MVDYHVDEKTLRLIDHVRAQMLGFITTLNKRLLEQQFGDYSYDDSAVRYQGLLKSTNAFHTRAAFFDIGIILIRFLLLFFIFVSRSNRYAGSDYFRPLQGSQRARGFWLWGRFHGWFRSTDITRKLVDLVKHRGRYEDAQLHTLSRSILQAALRERLWLAPMEVFDYLADGKLSTGDYVKTCLKIQEAVIESDIEILKPRFVAIRQRAWESTKLGCEAA